MGAVAVVNLGKLHETFALWRSRLLAKMTWLKNALLFSSYELQNKTKCIDIDECKIHGTCSQRCTNEIGSYKVALMCAFLWWNKGWFDFSFLFVLCYQCDCDKGYKKDPNNLNRCTASVGGNASLIVGFQNDMRRISIDHPDEMLIIQNVNYTRSLTVFDYSYQTKEVFWCDVGHQSIFRTSIDDKNGYNRKVIRALSKYTTVNGLAVDWIYKHIFYTQYMVNSIIIIKHNGSFIWFVGLFSIQQSSYFKHNYTIVVTDFDGTMETTLLSGDSAGEPYAIALDPTRGRMYWTDCGKNPHIERANLDGTMRETIIDKSKINIITPIALTLDFSTNRIFWMDSKLSSISSCGFDGSNIRPILKLYKRLSNPYSLSVFEDYVYWTNWELGDVLEANKFNGSDWQTIVESKTVR